MKRADLEKQLGKKIAGRMAHEPHAERYGSASGTVADKREQREREKAAGLVPFAVKLPQALVARLQALATRRQASMNEVVAELLTRALDESDGAGSSEGKSSTKPARGAKNAA